MKYLFLIIINIILCIISIYTGIGSIHDSDILIYSRIPRLLSIIISGMSLSLAGLIIQQISKNRFASPSTVGVIESATVGLSISLLLFGTRTLFINTLFGFIFSCIGIFTVFNIFNHIKFKDYIYLPLIGIMFGKIMHVISSYLAYKYSFQQDLDAWLMGDFSFVTKGNYEILYISIPLLIITYLYSHSFTIIGFGKEFTNNLGINYNKIKNIGIFIVSLISAVTIISIGQLPFIGLITPNIVNMIYGSNISINLPYVCLYGTSITLLCDIISRIIFFPFEIPISLILGIIGSIFFIYIIIRGDRK